MFGDSYWHLSKIMCTVAVVAAVSSASLTVNEARLKNLKISWGESNFNTVHTTRKTPFGMFVMSGGTSQVSIYSCNSIAIAVVHGNWITKFIYSIYLCKHSNQYWSQSEFGQMQIWAMICIYLYGCIFIICSREITIHYNLDKSLFSTILWLPLTD